MYFPGVNTVFIKSQSDFIERSALRNFYINGITLRFAVRRIGRGLDGRFVSPPVETSLGKGFGLFGCLFSSHNPNLDILNRFL